MAGPAASTPPPTLTVSQLNRKARTLLESHFDFVWVTGEISNFVAPSSGHWYFSLKDGGAQVRCAMFRNRNQRLRLRPGNGDAVRLRCRVSLYEGRGEFQLIAEHLEPEGAGALQAAFEALKAKLQTEGLFDSARKKPLPTRIRHLAIITSPTGAAIHDMLTVLGRRSPGIEISLLPVAVQGKAAALEICEAIEQANRWHREGKLCFDAIIVGRGGGSLEDLWSFNEETVARSIAASELPVVSAVGHEVDFSIADLVADKRAATPSAAAEMLSPDDRERLTLLAGIDARFHQQMRRTLVLAGTELGHLERRLKHPGQQIQEQAQRLDDLEQRLLFAQAAASRQRRATLDLLSSRLQANSPRNRLNQLQTQVNHLSLRAEEAMRRKLDSARNSVGLLGQLLDSLSPLRTLDRGYAIISDGEGGIVTTASAVTQGQTLEARLSEGKLHIEVLSIEPGNGSQTD